MNSLRQEWQAVWQDERERWLFALRTAGGCLLALYLAFQLELNSPSSAAVTVAIISLPQSGHVIEKAFYRLLGTLVGGAVSLLLVGAFVQQPEVFLAGLAGWIGLCSGLSLQRRNFRAYAFVLSGYTACIVGYPAFMAPEQAFQIAVDRLSAVTLGLLCGTVINSIVLPRSATAVLVQSVRKRLPAFVTLAHAVLRDGAPRSEVRRLQEPLLHDINALEAIRGASYFEDADSRIRSARLRRLNNEFMSSCTAMHAIFRLREDLHKRERNSILVALAPLTDAMLAQLKSLDGAVPATAAAAESVAAGFQRWLAGWEQHVQAARSRLAETDSAAQRELETDLQFLLGCAQDLNAYLQTYAALPDLRPHEGDDAAAPAVHSDGLIMLVAGLRPALGIGLAGAFWMASAWTHGFDALIQVCVFPALFASAPNPIAAVKGVAKGFSLGALITLPFYLLLLPQLDGFAELAWVHLPLIALCGYWMSRPTTASRGFGALMMLMTGVRLTNPMHYDVVEFLNRIVATFVGFGFVVLLYTALPLPGPEWITARLQRLLARQLRIAARQPLETARQQFETSVSDLMIQLSGRLEADAREHQLEAGLAVLESGHALLLLRQLPQTDSGIIDDTASAFEQPEQADRLLARIESRLGGCASVKEAAALRLLQMGLQAWSERTWSKMKTPVETEQYRETIYAA